MKLNTLPFEQIIVACDVDDTVLDLVPKWLSTYNKIYNDDLEPKQIKKWDIASYTKLNDNKDEFYKLINPALYRSISLVEGAFEGVQSLRNFARVVFVTSNIIETGQIKFDTLNKLGFDITKDDFIEAHDKSLIACHFMIDDNVINVQNCYGQGILLAKPWNARSKFTPRFSTWEEIVDYIKSSIAEKI